jgi:glycosyltransferase involved in cell wall biosynthesis
MNLPSFSIVYETENLSSVDLKNIYHSLASLNMQEVSLESANEFLLINSGNLPDNIIQELCLTYKWIKVKNLPDIGYYQSKMIGASLVTGQIVVFADSDCIYDKGWLKNILSTFLSNENINVVAGETSTPIRNLYDLAIAIHYLFPRFSNCKDIYSAKNYSMNNVSFKRSFLLENPILTDLPLYRASCYVHAYNLCNIMKYEILKNPQARSNHEPPTISFHFWRYLLRGRDNLIKENIVVCLLENPSLTDFTFVLQKFNDLSFQDKVLGIISSFLIKAVINPERLKAVLKEDPHRFWLLPLAVPIILWFEFLYRLGRAITYIHPTILMNYYMKVMGGK